MLGTSIAQGFSYEVPAGNGVRDYFIEYYKDLGNNCYARSPKSPVYIYSSPKINSPVTESKFIYDLRHLDEEDCFATRKDPATQQTYPYYADLPDATTIDKLFQVITDAIGGTQNPCFAVSDIDLESQWEVTDQSHITSDHWYDVTNTSGVAVKRVCAENITPNEAETGFKLYALKGSYRFNFKYCGVDGQLLSGGDVNCPINGALHKVRIATRPPGSAVDFGCLFPPEAIVESLVDKEGNTCNRRENFTICPAEKIKIGPTSDEVASYFFGGVVPPNWESFVQYEWLDGDGLSATNIRNAEVGYDAVPVPNYNIKVYHCKITLKGMPAVINPATTTYCAFIYKCGKCESIVDKPSSPY